jgi:hypothetical protein
MGTIGTIASIAGTVITAAGAANQYGSAAAAAEYNAELTRMESAAEERRRRRESQRRLGAIKGARAKSGVAMEGTPLMVLADSVAEAELDALNARWTGEASARLYDQNAKSSRKAIPYAVGSSLLTGISNIAGRKL